MLVSELIERTYNEFLYPGGINRPSFDKLASGIDASTPTIPFGGLTNEVPDDTVVEIDSELILLENVSGTTGTAKERGWLESGAATHSAGATVWIDPTFTRKAILNAIATVIGLLYPAGIYCRKMDTGTTFSYAQPVKDLPAGGVKLLSIDVKSVGTVIDWNPLRPGIDYREMTQFSPPKYRLYRGGSEGAVMQVVYKADFSRPTAETDDLSTLPNPLPDTLQPFLPQAAAGYLLKGREVPRSTIEEIRRALAAQGVQVGASLNVGRSLMDEFMGRYAAAERDRLKELDPAGLEFTRR